MKKLVVFLLSLIAVTAFAQQKKVAVYVTGEDVSINKVLGSKLVSAIAHNGDYSVIERTDAFLSELRKEQYYQRTGTVDDSELSRLGRQFGVDYLCVAAVSDVFNESYISARLINVETAQVERSTSTYSNLKSLQDVVSSADTLSVNLFLPLDRKINSKIKKVAVYVVKSDAGKEIGKVLGDKIVAGFANSGRYVAVERTNSFLVQLNKEHDYQQSGAVDDNELSRLGKQFGVQYVCVVDITDIFGEKYISTRLVDVETAEVANTFDINGEINDMNSCLQMANEISLNLSKGTLKEQVEEERLRAEKERREAEEQERIRQAEIAAQEAKRQECLKRIDKRKAELQAMYERGYIIYMDGGVKWMLLLSPVEVTAKEIRDNVRFKAIGFSDWEPFTNFSFYLYGIFPHDDAKKYYESLSNDSKLKVEYNLPYIMHEFRYYLKKDIWSNMENKYFWSLPEGGRLPQRLRKYSLRYIWSSKISLLDGEHNSLLELEKDGVDITNSHYGGLGIADAIRDAKWENKTGWILLRRRM